MWRLIKKWWFLQRLEEAIALHTGKGDLEQILLNQKTIVSSQKFFIYGTDDYPGIVRKPLGGLSWILFWRKHEGEEKLKRRIHEYNNFFRYWIEKKYIVMEETPQGVFVNTTHLADDIHGWAGLIQLVADTFKVPWGIIVVIITFLIGLNWHEILRYFVRAR